MTTSKIQNSPISFDYHGESSLSTPFETFKPSDISLYIDLDTYIGKNTCGQACEHCWFVANEKVKNKAFDIQEGKLITDQLKEKGYNVYPRYTDTFAYNGEFMRLYGPVHNREFRQEMEKKETDTMLDGDAWTSGKPLLAENYIELLDLAYESGYRTISMTFHGLIDENMQLIKDQKYPIKGVFLGKDCETVIDRIFNYNKNNDRQFRVNIGITVGTHNGSRTSLLRYAHYFNSLGVSTVRFNNFTDHGGNHSHLEMDNFQTAEVYKDIKWINENIQLSFQLGVSEDMGTYGIEVMGFPKEVGWCQAGHQFFTIIQSDEEELESEKEYSMQKIGEIVGCVNLFEPYLGYLFRRVNNQNNAVTYDVHFNTQSINTFNSKRVNGDYENGCYAKELKEEIKRLKVL